MAYFGVWAAATNVPITICEDARLRAAKDSDVLHLGDSTRGVAGYTWGINFASLSNLADQLNGPTPSHTCGNWWMSCDKLANNSITRLAINVHGTPGGVDINCGRSISTGSEQFNVELLKADTAKPGGKFNADLLRLKKLLAADANVLFMGCSAGAGKPGTEFVIALSEVFAGSVVTAFATIGFSSAEQQKRQSGDVCGEPGMRDTEYETPSVYMPPNAEYTRYFRDKQWWDLSKLPWASERSPHAKSARDGKVIRGELL